MNKKLDTFIICCNFTSSKRQNKKQGSVLYEQKEYPFKNKINDSYGLHDLIHIMDLDHWDKIVHLLMILLKSIL